MKTEADATRTNQSEVTGISCGKPDYLSSARTLSDARDRRQAVELRAWLPIHNEWCLTLERAAPRREGGMPCGSKPRSPLSPGHHQREARQAVPKTKDPSGGTAGRVKPYGRWGGWALAPYTASMGRDYHSHMHWSQKGSRTFKPVRAFFGFSGRNFGAEFIALRGSRRPHDHGPAR